MRDMEIKALKWTQIYLDKSFVQVSDAEFAAQGISRRSDSLPVPSPLVDAACLR